MQFKRLWISLGIVLIASFAVLGGVGYKGIKSAPPLPTKLVTTDGQVLFAGQTVMDGQNVWQSIGGQEIGTIWGHGAYVAPDWSADWLHRECVIILDRWAQATGRGELRGPAGGTAGCAACPPAGTDAAQHLRRFNGNGDYRAGAGRRLPALASLLCRRLRAAGAPIMRSSRRFSDAPKQQQMSAFFWWTAWAASTDRPGQTSPTRRTGRTKPFIGNQPTGGAVVWSVISFVLLLAGVGGMVWYFASQPRP